MPTESNGQFGGPSPFYATYQKDTFGDDFERLLTKLKEVHKAALSEGEARLKKEAAQVTSATKALDHIRRYIDGPGDLSVDDYDSISNILSWVGQ